MSWLSKLFGKEEVVANLGGKTVALAVVDNPSGATLMDSGGSKVSPTTIKTFIEKDLARYPELRSDVAAIQGIRIVADENISSFNYAQDITQCYLKYMNSEGWNSPKGLHIFEVKLGPATIYTAYGTN